MFCRWGSWDAARSRYSGPSLLTSDCQQFTSAPYYLSHVRVHHWITCIGVQITSGFVLQMSDLGRSKKPLSKSSAQRQRLARQLRSRREAGAATAVGSASVAAGNRDRGVLRDDDMENSPLSFSCQSTSEVVPDERGRGPTGCGCCRHAP